MSEIVVTVADIRAVFCTRGARTWFEKNGWDFRDFLKNGVPISKVDELNDGLGNMVAAHARSKAGVNNGK